MFHLTLVSQSGIKYDADVSEVMLPTMDGQIGVLTDHMPLISVTKPGVISIRRQPHDTEREMDHFATYGGVLEFEHNNLIVVVDEADAAESINELEAQKAYDAAQRMKAEAKDQLSLERAQALVDRHAVRLQVATIKRRHYR
ncbi:ATP synthase F1 subunit epsilon [Patescibacteria group bacterium]|nr:ATP synthase F1 subunit epsilon [Patescibacteria group bacterium]